MVYRCRRYSRLLQFTRRQWTRPHPVQKLRLPNSLPAFFLYPLPTRHNTLPVYEHLAYLRYPFKTYLFFKATTKTTQSVKMPSFEIGPVLQNLWRHSEAEVEKALGAAPSVPVMPTIITVSHCAA
jgi:hypothetical protein